MTERELNLMVAGLCGWEILVCLEDTKMFECVNGIGLRGGLFNTAEEAEIELPDYTGDLNLCWGFENTIPVERREEYANNLFQLVPCNENCGPLCDGGEDLMVPSSFDLSHVSAIVRCFGFCVFHKAMTIDQAQEALKTVL